MVTASSFLETTESAVMTREDTKQPSALNFQIGKFNTKNDTAE